MINDITTFFHYKMYQLIVCFFFLLLFFHLPLDIHALSFNYPNFSDQPKLNLSGDASIFDGILSLTKNQAGDNLVDSVGRAIYPEDLQLFDSNTGKAADFITHFSFTITKLDFQQGGDGIAFFLAPNGSQVPENSSAGCLGLISNCSDNFNWPRKLPIVAVEFDTYHNVWDPTDDHVGININSIQSAENRTRSMSFMDRTRAHACISYDSNTKNLSVSTYLDPPYSVQQFSLSYEINLSKVLPERVSVGFSSSTGSHPELHSILSWEFNSTEFNSTEFIWEGRENSKGNKIIRVVFVSVASGMFLVSVIPAIITWFGWGNGSVAEKNLERDDSMDYEFEHGMGPKRFAYSKVVRATNNFAEEEKLGQGGFGGVYKGFLADLKLDVAVKKVSRGSRQGRKEYKSEIQIISRLRHKNLVQLVGWCHEKGELILIYEFMSNGSLDSHLFGGKSMLSWAVRYNIALGLASSLLYLHEEAHECVVHRDIKSSNVMLDSNFDAKLGDFGLARLMDHEVGLKTTGLAGTFGYMAPEYISTSKASKGSDVYSFGVVALEIACGKRSTEGGNEEDHHILLVAWVWEAYGNGRLLDVADRKLRRSDLDTEQLECLMMVGLWCAHPDHNLRPSIRQAIQVLNLEAPLPNLPKQMPVPRFDASNSSAGSSVPLLSSSLVSIGR